MTRPPANIAASVKQRLLNLSRESGDEFNTLLVRYAIERFLYRLSKSKHAANMVLKGAMLFVVWRPTSHRPTRDLDLLGFGDPTPEAVAENIRGVLSTAVEDDGLVFDMATIETSRIREDQEYEGVRATFVAMLGKARIDLQVDVGFGDAAHDTEQKVLYPSLLGFPAPLLRMYTRETVVAEKAQAMVDLGQGNSRMKDFYDILILSREFEFNRSKLAAAIKATFERRRTPLPSVLPFALTDQFGSDGSKQAQWAAFLKRLHISDAPTDLAAVIVSLRNFLMLPLGIAAAPQATRWLPGGPWA